jgi:natural resistance-associated macrophage protein 2
MSQDYFNLPGDQSDAEFGPTPYESLQPVHVADDDTSDYYTTEDESPLQETIKAEVQVIVDEHTHFSWKKLWRYTGPGFLMSIAYLDPGNLESDLQAGAVAGYSLIWVLFWATVMGFAFQVLSLRLGVVTGNDLAQICRREYPRPVAYAVWVMTEIAIIGSDIQEVIGSAIAMNILFGLKLWVGVLITALDTFTFMFLHFFGVRKLEAFFGFLITVMAVCFAVFFGIGGPDAGSILEGMVLPRIPKGSLEQGVGMLGAVVMPHNLFLHSSLVLSRQVHRNHPSRIREANYYFTIEAAISLFVSFLINVCVVAVFATGFYVSGHPRTDIGLKTAGDDLLHRFGKGAQIVWAVGLLAAGQSSTMTGTFAGQYVMEGFLQLKITPWARTLFTRTIALGPALAVAIVAHNELDVLDEYLNVLQSVQLPFAMLPVFFFNCSSVIMGQFAMGKKMKIAFAAMVIVVVITNGYLVFDFTSNNFSNTWLTWVIAGSTFAIYLAFILYLTYKSAYPERKILVATHSTATLYDGNIQDTDTLPSDIASASGK